MNEDKLILILESINANLESLKESMEVLAEESEDKQIEKRVKRNIFRKSGYPPM